MRSSGIEAVRIAVSRRRLMISASASALLAAGGCATRSAAAAALAPTGRLRASINLGNPILANRDAATG